MCEVLCHILAKAILQVISIDMLDAFGLLQKCSGMSAGIGEAVHAMTSLCEDPTTEGILSIDVKTPSIASTASPLSTISDTFAPHWLWCYRTATSPLHAFLSAEGTKQGYPLSMAFSSLTILLLIQHLQTNHTDIYQVWYVDDFSGAGQIQQLRQ